MFKVGKWESSIVNEGFYSEGKVGYLLSNKKKRSSAPVTLLR